MAREISTATINSDIQKVLDKSNITDGINTFDSLYKKVIPFVKHMMLSEPELRLNMSYEHGDSFELTMYDKSYEASHIVWSMKFPINYIDTIKDLFEVGAWN